MSVRHKGCSICWMLVSFIVTDEFVHDELLTGEDALSASKLERIVIDASHIDQKKRGILDMKEIQMPLVKLLSKPEFKERYGVAGEERIDLLFF